VHLFPDVALGEAIDIIRASWADTLTTLYTEYQMNTFVFWPGADRERQSRIVAEEVVPAVREALGPAARTTVR
jgi:hypothetical protein